MILAKGVELIPKRDKVTIATNILGKWEDYSIESPQGKILKEAAERYRVMLKEGKEDAVALEVPSLKEKLLNPVKEEAVDFWTVPNAECATEVKEVEVVIETQDDDTCTEVVKVEELPDIPDTVDLSDDTIVVVKAYKQRDRQVYLSGWDDSDDWLLSVVPHAMAKSKAVKMISKATKQIEEANKKATIRSRFPSDLKFEIVPWIDSTQHVLTEDEIRKQAEEMIRAHRESRGKK